MSTSLEKLQNLYKYTSQETWHSVFLERDQRCHLEQKGCSTMNTLSTDTFQQVEWTAMMADYNSSTSTLKAIDTFSPIWLLHAKTVLLWEVSPKTQIHGTTNMTIEQSKYRI